MNGLSLDNVLKRNSMHKQATIHNVKHAIGKLGNTNFFHSLFNIKKQFSVEDVMEQQFKICLLDMELLLSRIR